MGQPGGSACLPIPHKAPAGRELFPGGLASGGARRGREAAAFPPRALWGGGEGGGVLRGVRRASPEVAGTPQGAPDPQGAEGLTPSCISSRVRRAPS